LGRIAELGGWIDELRGGYGEKGPTIDDRRLCESEATIDLRQFFGAEVYSSSLAGRQGAGYAGGSNRSDLIYRYALCPAQVFLRHSFLLDWRFSRDTYLYF
jgi:hypothetical protein